MTMMRFSKAFCFFKFNEMSSESICLCVEADEGEEEKEINSERDIQKKWDIKILINREGLG